MNRHEERALIRDAAERTKDPWLDYMYRFAEASMTPAAWRDALELARHYTA